MLFFLTLAHVNKKDLKRSHTFKDFHGHQGNLDRLTPLQQRSSESTKDHCSPNARLLFSPSGGQVEPQGHILSVAVGVAALHFLKPSDEPSKDQIPTQRPGRQSETFKFRSHHELHRILP